MENQQEKKLSPWKIGLVIVVLGGIVFVSGYPITGTIILILGLIITTVSTL